VVCINFSSLYYKSLLLLLPRHQSICICIYRRHTYIDVYIYTGLDNVICISKYIYTTEGSRRCCWLCHVVGPQRSSDPDHTWWCRPPSQLWLHLGNTCPTDCGHLGHPCFSSAEDWWRQSWIPSPDWPSRAWIIAWSQRKQPLSAWQGYGECSWVLCHKLSWPWHRATGGGQPRSFLLAGRPSLPTHNLLLPT